MVAVAEPGDSRRLTPAFAGVTKQVESMAGDSGSWLTAFGVERRLQPSPG